MHPDAAAGLPDADPDLQELEPQGIDLGRSRFRALEVVAQQPKQAVGRGVEQQPELIGQDAMATRAIGLDLQFKFLDALFYVAPEHVDVVLDKLGVAAQTSDHEPLIRTKMGIFHLEITGIMEAAGDVFREAVALVQLPEHQAAGIGGNPAPGKIGNNFLGKKAFKPELVMADRFPRVSWPRSCLFSDNSMLADTICFFKHFS